MDLKKNKAEKVRRQSEKSGGSWKQKLYGICFALVFFVIPFCVANFVDGGDEFLQALLPLVVGFIAALIINWLRWSKHITAVENEDANDYIKKEDIEITYTYDEFTHTD